MRLWTPLIASLALFSNTYALPFRLATRSQALRPRASYAVVAVDGGSAGATVENISPAPTQIPNVAPADAGLPDLNIASVIAPPTILIQTVLKVETETIAASPIIQNQIQLQTVTTTQIEQASQNPRTETATVTQRIPQTITILTTAIVPTISIVRVDDQRSNTATQRVSLSPSIVASSKLSTTPSSTSFSAVRTSPLVEVIIPATTPSAGILSSSTSYDDGMWHTYYPPWNETSAAAKGWS